MMQTELFAASAAPVINEAALDVREPADAIDRDLRASSLPYEVIVDGKRRCRHHRDQVIASRGVPCGGCWRERPACEPVAEDVGHG